MPVISPTRYSTATGSSSYNLPPSIGGTKSSLAKNSSGYGSVSNYHSSSYRSSSLSNSSSYLSGGYSNTSSYSTRTSYRSSLPSTSYRTSSYLTGGNNDTTAASRFGVSSNKYSRASSDRDTLKRAAGKTQFNNNTINTASRSTALQTKPPTGASSSSIRHRKTSSDTARSRDNSQARVTSKSDPNSNCVNNYNTSDLNEQPKNKISSSLSSSSLARQVATSGLELYEKYSPAHYIPKCELSRSRSLSEATSSSNRNSSIDSGLSNSSGNVHQLLQGAKETNQQKQQNQNENDLQNLNLKSSSPSSPSHDTSSSTSTKDDSKVKNLCAVSTTASTNNNICSNFAIGSVVLINNKSSSNSNALPSCENQNCLKVSSTSITSSYNLIDDLDLFTVSSNNYNFKNSRTITHTSSSSDNIQPSINSTVVQIVTSHGPSERLIKSNSKNNNSKDVNKITTTIPFEQPKTNPLLSTNSAVNLVNPNSVSKILIKSSKSKPSIATCTSATSDLSNSTTIVINQTKTPSLLKSSATVNTPATASTLPSSCQTTVVSSATRDKYLSINNAILKIAKSTLKPTKQLSSNKLIDDKIMTNLYSELHDSNNNINKKIISPNVTLYNSSQSISVKSFLMPTTESVADKQWGSLENKSNGNTLGTHLELCKSKCNLPVEITKVSNSNPVNGTSSIKRENPKKLVCLAYREPNFLKSECELARSQVTKSSEIPLSEDNNRESKTSNNNVLVNNRPGTQHIKYDKNLIKPLVHKISNSKQIEKLTQIQLTSNMNYTERLQNVGDQDIDDIKYIDSDDSERQHYYNQSYRTATGTCTSTSSVSAVINTTGSIYSSQLRTLSNRKDINCVINNKVSTLPLTSKHRDQMYSSNNSKNDISKYNTLNDFKRLPSTLYNNPRGSNLHKNVELISSSSSSSSSPSSSTTPVRTLTTPPEILSKAPDGIHHQYDGTLSHVTTPSNSPQTFRRQNALVMSNALQQSSGDFVTTSSALRATTQQSSNVISSILPIQQELSTTSTASSNLEENNFSNKSYDNDENVRNATTRSVLPPSPTPSRYWDREGGRSLLAAGRCNLNDTEDRSTTKSSSNASNVYDKIATEGLCGLRNIGNTCFMNSVIQCLSHTRELTKFLKTQVSIKSSTKDQQILVEFAKLIREMWSPSVRSVTPLELKSAFSSKHRMYSGYNQQDAQEFLRFFLDSLHCALNTGVKGEQLKIDDSLSDNRKADLTWEWYCKIENSVIRDLFVGQLKSTLKCTTCGNTSVTFDPFWDLSVPLPSSTRCKLDACLDLFIREEILDGDEMPTCSKCQARRKCMKSLTIQRFPKYLVIHLKRFSETRWSKLSNVVEFPTGERELNMAPYASNANVSATYSLYGVSNHMGSTAGGHYVALCKHPITKKWHEFNDNVVSEALSESVLVSSSAYLLFYERA